VGLSPETCRVKAFAKNKTQFVASHWNYFHYKSTMHGTTNIKKVKTFYAEVDI